MQYKTTIKSIRFNQSQLEHIALLKKYKVNPNQFIRNAFDRIFFEEYKSIIKPKSNCPF